MKNVFPISKIVAIRNYLLREHLSNKRTWAQQIVKPEIEYLTVWMWCKITMTVCRPALSIDVLFRVSTSWIQLLCISHEESRKDRWASNSFITPVRAVFTKKFLKAFTRKYLTSAKIFVSNSSCVPPIWGSSSLIRAALHLTFLLIETKSIAPPNLCFNSLPAKNDFKSTTVINVIYDSK